MYQHPKLAAFTDALDALLREADAFLEDEWGDVFSLHPNRPARGATENPEMDGLFEVGADFTAGFGSEHGRGYSVAFRAATLEKIPPEQFEFLMNEAAAFIRRRLPASFPGRALTVVRDGGRFKITGDLSLGEA